MYWLVLVIILNGHMTEVSSQKTADLQECRAAAQLAPVQAPRFLFCVSEREGI